MSEMIPLAAGEASLYVFFACLLYASEKAGSATAVYGHSVTSAMYDRILSHCTVCMQHL